MTKEARKQAEELSDHLNTELAFADDTDIAFEAIAMSLRYYADHFCMPFTSHKLRNAADDISDLMVEA